MIDVERRRDADLLQLAIIAGRSALSLTASIIAKTRSSGFSAERLETRLVHEALVRSPTLRASPLAASWRLRRLVDDRAQLASGLVVRM